MRLVADANVLLPALIGGRAQVALTHSSVQGVYAATATLDEVHEYVPVLARKKRLPLDVLLLTLAALPNDGDFREAGVEWFTTATRLKRLGVSSAQDS